MFQILCFILGYQPWAFAVAAIAIIICNHMIYHHHDFKAKCCQMSDAKQMPLSISVCSTERGMQQNLILDNDITNTSECGRDIEHMCCT